MESAVFWVLFQIVIYSAGVAAWGENKTIIKVDEMEQVIRYAAKDCYPPRVNREQFLALMVVALSTGRIANTPETRCFVLCVMSNYKLIVYPGGKVNTTMLNITISNMTHPLVKTIIMNNMELCTAAWDSSDLCINGLKYARCFAKQGLFVYVRLEESNFPTTKVPKIETASRNKAPGWSLNKLWFDKAKKTVATTLPSTLPANVTTVAAVSNVTTVATNVTAVG